ncbi:MAG: MaoC family dehydratase, partial [Alphaproteobacteria bacterium]|nr:MaoC family dehydratase [Alphaproteobacteria bacterium]
MCTPAMLDHYCDGLTVDRARYNKPNFWDKPAAPAMMVSQVDVGYKGAQFENAFGNLWIRQEWDFHHPIFPDREYRRTSTILDIYEWRNRSVVKQEVSVFDGSKLIVRGIHHQSFLLNQTSGKLALRDPKKKEGVRKFEAPAGETIESIDRNIDIEMCGVFFHGNRSYHTDKSASEALGFDEVVVGGRMTMSLIGQMLEQHFGQGYYEGGTLDVKFVNIVWPDDHVTAKGVITDTKDGKANIKVWMEKDDGTVAVVGSASAVI